MFVAKKANIGGIHDCFKRSMLFKPSLNIENRVENINRTIKGFQEPCKISPMWTSNSPIIKHKYNLAYRSYDR
jgi:hypothetical protein